MLLSTEISIAVKNNENYNLKKLSLFDIGELNKTLSTLHISLTSSKSIVIKVKCDYCGSEHVYKYKLHDFIRKELIVGGCEILGMPIFYVGKEITVKSKIMKYGKINSKILAMI